MAKAFVDVSKVLLYPSILCSQRRHCGRFVTLFWPKKVKASKLEEIHAKMVMKEAADPNLKKPRQTTSEGLKTNGSSSVPASSSVRSNSSKSYR